MFIERLLNQGNLPLLQQTARFTELRHELLMENVANVSTPGYRQKDLSLEKFQEVLERQMRSGEPAAPVDIENPTNGILFHDGNNRSMEQLMSDSAKNALMHNLVVELLRRQLSSIQTALKERVS